MRFVMTLFLWVLTTILLAVAVPSAWVQKNVIDQQGYSAFAAAAATDPQLQQAVAGELTTQVQSLAAKNGSDVDSRQIRAVAGRLHRGLGVPRTVRPGQPDRAHLDVHRPVVPERERQLGDRPGPDALR